MQLLKMLGRPCLLEVAKHIRHTRTMHKPNGHLKRDCWCCISIRSGPLREAQDYLSGWLSFRLLTLMWTISKDTRPSSTIYWDSTIPNEDWQGGRITRLLQRKWYKITLPAFTIRLDSAFSLPKVWMYCEYFQLLRSSSFPMKNSKW